MSPVLLYIIVLLVAAIPFLESTLIIPIGILAGLNAWSVTILSLIANIITFLLAVILAERLKIWLGKRRRTKQKRKEDKHEKASKLWNKYGLPGLAIIHPVTVGSSHATALIALSLGASKKSTTLWVGGSIIVWAIAFAVLSFLGADFIYAQIDADGFLNQWFNLN
ncbi:small multi-drug export protein [Salicibibacter cibarius]|uniref:Small multi-drug export protein n=1 Tax=Salicibibacter cibarius TaxID=2743000 RepID=A0A7T6Z227_9BACI|nr:small multi-drug export protein [Salicibibacter cibarius]QQK74876.1 small multi-drug export protein [Salicibibacter cibarius]